MMSGLQRAVCSVEACPLQRGKGRIFLTANELSQGGIKMKSERVRQALLVLLVMALLLAPATAFSWGAATHAYIADHIGKEDPLRNGMEIYGAMAPDLFNFMFDDPDSMEYYTLTHASAPEVWESARTKLDKSFAWGFVSHNNVNGADLTAHGPLPIPFLDPSKGYVVAKAYQLLFYSETPASTILEVVEGMAPTADPKVRFALALEVSHNIVEYAVDILLSKDLDQNIGAKITSAALCRPPTVPLLLVRAYGEEIARFNDRPALTILKTEREFRQMMVLYGQALSQDTDVAVGLVAGQLASLSEGFLVAYGMTPPSADQLTPLITSWIQQAMGLCTQPDSPTYADVLNDTIDFVKASLADDGITYCAGGRHKKHFE
jgi:hypothetical protein